MHLFVNYGPAIYGVNLYGYGQTLDPKKYGFEDLGSFYKRVFSLVDKHSEEAEWLPLVIAVCDEPVDADIEKASANASLLRECSTERIRFAGLTSLSAKTDGEDRDAHLALVRNLDIAGYNTHDAWSIDRAGDWAFYNGGTRWTYGFYMFMLRQKYDMKFRVSWHWNINAGDPYYALDCREDDYAWVNSNARGELVTTVHFERIREGIDDYRYLLTLANVLEKNADHPLASEARSELDGILSLVPGKNRNDSEIWSGDDRGEKLRSVRRRIAKLIGRIGGQHR